MEMQQLLISKATEAISALWFNQLEIIHKSTGIEMQVLINCLNMQVNVEPAREPEKKKRAPAKKKEASPAETKTSTKTSEEEETDSDPNTNAALPEKKKRAPAKKKETPAEAKPDSDPDSDPALPEKKKRAPAKKKETPTDGEKEEVPPTDDTAKKEAEALEKKAMKEAEALEKKAMKEAEALEKKAKKEAEALEKKAKKEAEALEKKAKKEAEALEKKAKEQAKEQAKEEKGEDEKKKAAPKKKKEQAKEEKGEDEKKKKAAPKAEDKKKKGKQVVAAAPLLIPKFGANEQVRYVRPNGKTVDVIIEYAIQQEDYVEYRLQVVGKNETILSREESLFELEERVADPDSSDDDADTVKMADSPQSSPSKPGEEVDINGTLYVIDENKVAYLKSSNKMAGKYDRVRHTICQMQPEEDIYSEHSDEDELPVSDLSDSESGYESN